MDNKIEEWLLEHGGPAIHLRLASIDGSKVKSNDVNSIISALVNIDEVHLILNRLDGFQIPGRDKKTLEYLIHSSKDTCIESFFPLILDMGFKAGIPIFDDKMAYVADIFNYLYSKEDEHDYCYYYAGMLHRFFFMTGCLFPEVIKSMEDRLNAIHIAAKENILDIYQDESKLPKKPKAWAEVRILRDELNPFKLGAEKPLPNIYDLWALAYYTEICTNTEKLIKIDDIVKYILEPEFQKIREGYGLLWAEERRTYYACGWSPTLPLCGSNACHVRKAPFLLLDYIDFMSLFKISQKSKWFHDCLNHLEQFKTEKGTYIFPKEYLHKKYIDKAFLNDSNMSLKRNERELLKRELVSTMKMLEINKRLT
ncbi:MAG: hypothetical protein FWG91_01330 [Lachnospiraceae bacterium]|nr:hypothetical protein [Lachnospiraceae bacterium]